MRYLTLPVSVEYGRVGAVAGGEPVVLDAYLLDSSKEIPGDALKPAVVLCPGGAYAFRSDREAEPIAMRLLAAGVHVFLLHYSVAPARWPAAALELAQAVRMVRRNAKEWNVRPDSVYVMGFSAGGHLAGSLGVLWDEPVFHEALGGACDWKPDGMLLGYPVVTMGRYTHAGSRDNLLGADAPADKLDSLSLERRVTPKTVPAFLWHTWEDEAVPVENTLDFARALRACGVPFELHLYERGGHGLSLCDERTSFEPKQLVPDNTGWMALAARWVRRHSDK